MRDTSIEGTVPYTGRELRGGWIRDRTGIAEDAIVSFVGPADVATADLVDDEDRAAGTCIRAISMLHFLIEQRGVDLELQVWRQRMLTVILAEALAERGVEGLRRDGDDLFVGDRKLTVSIATRSPMTLLIHVGVNVNPAGAPVPAVGLLELGIDLILFADDVRSRYVREQAGVRHAASKVRLV